MCHQLEDAFSELYLQFLGDLKSSSSFPPFIDMTTLEPPEDSEDKYMLNDRKFFFKILPKLVSILHTKFPRLAQQASQANAKNDNPIAAYNKDTYIEYHHVLCELLRR